MDMFYIQRGAARTFRLGPGAIVNHIADPDLCSLALDDVAVIVRRTNKPCFNHPAFVARTTRDGVAKLLTGIPGLTVPKTLRIPPSWASMATGPARGAIPSSNGAASAWRSMGSSA